MAYRHEFEIGDAIFTQEIEIADCHECGCEKTREIEGEGFVCAECGTPIFHNNGEHDDFVDSVFFTKSLILDYLEEIEAEMGDGD